MTNQWTHMVMVASPHDVENVVATFDRAAEANRQMPGRQGSTVVLTPELAEEVMITGDVHGHRRNFDRIRQIAALDENPGRHLVSRKSATADRAIRAAAACHTRSLRTSRKW